MLDKHTNKGISPIKQTQHTALPQGSCATQMHLTSIYQAYSTRQALRLVTSLVFQPDIWMHLSDGFLESPGLEKNQ